MQPPAQIRAMLEIERYGWELLAIYHSHPIISRFEPSQTDLRENTYPDALMVIIAPTTEGHWLARAFQIIGTNYRQVTIEVD